MTNSDEIPEAAEAKEDRNEMKKSADVPEAPAEKETTPAADAAPTADDQKVGTQGPSKSTETQAASETPPPAAEPEKTGETPSAAEQQVALLSQQLEAAADKYLRLRADLDNFRKRKLKEMDDLRRNTTIATLEAILPVMDQFLMAVDAMRNSDDVATIKQGMDLILNGFKRAFESLGVETVKTAGEAFDHNCHEAITTEPSETVPEDHIVREWKAGYRLGEHLLRPAVVVVSSGPSATAAAVDEKTADEAETATPDPDNKGQACDPD